MQIDISLQKILKNIKRFKATIINTLLILIAFVFLSNANYFIETNQLLSLALTSFQLQNVIYYMLIHVGYNHLLVNLASFLAFSIIIEYCLGSRHSFAVFWISGMISGIIFVIINPNIALIGSSAGVSGLLGAAVITDWKKTIAGILIMIGITAFILFPLTFASFELFKENIKDKETIIQKDINKALEVGDINKAKDLNKNLQQTQQTIQQTQKGEEFAKTTPTSNIIHAIGAIIGIGYVLILKKRKKSGLIKH